MSNSSNLVIDLKLEQFEVSGFNVQAIIEKLAAPLAKETSVTADLDISGAVTAFEGCIKQITKLKKGVTSKLDDLEDLQKTVETKRHGKLGEISAAIESVQNDFKSLESELATNGYNVIRIGEQLESLDKQRSRAAEAKDLLDYYSELSINDRTRVDALKSSGLAGLGKVAIVARRVNEISHEVDNISQQSLRNIEKYCEDLEQGILSMFDRAYTKNDTAEMAQLARILYDFNGGNSCIQAYINQHPLFAANSRLSSILLHYTSKAPKQKSESRITTVANYYGMISEATLSAWANVKAIFPNAEHVMHVFIQRLFAQLVQPFVELICPTESLQSLEYLQVLAMIHHATVALADKLRIIDNDGDADLMLHSGKAANDHSVFGDEYLSSINSVSALLNRSIEETFILYTDCGRYIAAENKALENITSRLLQRFNAMLTALRQQAQRSKVSFFDTVKQAPKANTFKGIESAVGSEEILSNAEVHSAAATALSVDIQSPQTSSAQSPQPSSGQSVQQNAVQSPSSPLKVGKKSKKEIATAVGEELKRLLDDDGSLFDAEDMRELPEQISIVSLPIVKQMVHAHLEAVERCAELSHSSDFAPNFMLLLNTLLQNLGEQYLENAMLVMQEEMALFDPKQEPDFRCDIVLSLIMQALQLLKAYFENIMQSALRSFPQGQREFLVASIEFLSRMETMMNSILTKQSDNIVKYIASILLRQKKNDFKIKETDASQAQIIESPGTPAITALLQFLGKMYRIVNLCYGEVDAFLAVSILTEIGGGLLMQLLDHYRKFPVSETGALLLGKDINRIIDFVNSWNISSLSARFELLKLISSLFIVKAENWKSISLEGPLARFDISVLIPYLELRNDWSKLSKLEHLKHS